jgi:hypothetical protein
VTDRENWRRMEQFEHIAKSGPVFAGNLISKEDCKWLRERGLVRYRSTVECGDGQRNAGYVLTWRGRLLWWLLGGSRRV